VNVLTAINSKADKSTTYTKTEVDATFANLIDSAPTALNTLKELSSALGDDANYAATVQGQLANKAPLANPIFTGTVSGITKAMVGLANVDDTSDAAKPVSDATLSALNTKQNTLMAGAGATEAVLVSGKVKGLSSTQNISLSSTADVITITGPNLTGYATTTALNAKQDTLTAGAGASQAILASNKVKGLTSAQNVSLSSTADVITITGPDLSGYATTATVSGKQDTLTAGVGATQAILASGKIKGLTSAQNISLSSTADVITITGPSLTGYATTTAVNAKQDTLTAGVGASQAILASNKVKGLTSTQNVTLSSTADVITITGPNLTGYATTASLGAKQDTLSNGAGGQAVFSSPSTIKSLKSSGHVSLSSDASSITISNNTTDPQFTTSLQAPTVFTNTLWTIPVGMAYPAQISTGSGIGFNVSGDSNFSTNLSVGGNLSASGALNVHSGTINDYLAVVGTCFVDTISAFQQTQLSIPDDVVIGSSANNKNLTVNGNLSVSNFFPTKPWVGFLVQTDGVGVATISKHVGYNTTGISVNHPNNGAYVFTIPAHPNASNYLVMTSPYAAASSSTSTWPVGNAVTGTRMDVYCRSTIGATATVNGNFFVYTVP
jgi:hypothetical protein